MGISCLIQLDLVAKAQFNSVPKTNLSYWPSTNFIIEEGVVVGQLDIMG